ncbi:MULTISPECIES: YusW family protein [unclassified Bacillus (in: firmicutes)]|uniref:YusW family protein n=1 Tax=Bacillus TaxID=1386 RepID=UPI003390509F
MLCWKKAGLIGVLLFMMSGCQSIEPLKHTSEAEAESLSAVQMKELPFQHLHLHVQYGQKNDIYEATYRQRSGHEEALIRDHMNGVRYEGEEGLREMKMKLSDISAPVSKINETYVNELLTALNLDDDYQRIQVDLKLEDGTNRTFEKKK